MDLHVLGNEKFSAIQLSSLSEDDLKAWRSGLNPALKPNTVQRLASDLKAALNAAHKSCRKLLPADFVEIVRHGLNRQSNDVLAESMGRDNQILNDEQIRLVIRTVAAGDPDGDLTRLVIVLAATGARFSQVRRMKVRDLQVTLSRLLVPTSRKGKARADAYTPIRIGADVLEVLAPAIEGRDATEPLLCRWKHVQVSLMKWERVGRGQWQSASEMTRPWRVACEKLQLPGIVPYALRHSSIVRGIRAGLPIRLVAALHDTSVVMIERHYARWITDGLEELAARAIIPLTGDAFEEHLGITSEIDFGSRTCMTVTAS